jgi:signal peptidase I
MTETTSPDATLQSNWPSEPAGPAPPRRSRLWFLHELPVLVVVAFGLAFVLKTLLIQAFYIPSESMQPTLYGSKGHLGNDRVLVNKLAYRLRDPRRGEVIVFIAHEDKTQRSFVQKIFRQFGELTGAALPEDTDFIKRIIGLPGDTITVTDTGVWIKPAAGGKRFKLREPYINTGADTGVPCGGTGWKCPQGPTFGPFKVPKGKYFVMGDNRANSSDSRFSLGPVGRDKIIGKAFVRIWPWKRWHVIDSPTYPVPKATPKKKKPGALPLDLAPAEVLVAALVPARRRSDDPLRVLS